MKPLCISDESVIFKMVIQASFLLSMTSKRYPKLCLALGNLNLGLKPNISQFLGPRYQINCFSVFYHLLVTLSSHIIFLEILAFGAQINFYSYIGTFVFFKKILILYLWIATIRSVFIRTEIYLTYLEC